MPTDSKEASYEASYEAPLTRKIGLQTQMSPIFQLLNTSILYEYKKKTFETSWQFGKIGILVNSIIQELKFCKLLSFLLKFTILNFGISFSHEILDAKLKKVIGNNQHFFSVCILKFLLTGAWKIKIPLRQLKVVILNWPVCFSEIGHFLVHYKY